jgi:hypothetical protein
MEKPGAILAHQITGAVPGIAQREDIAEDLALRGRRVGVG